MDKTLLDDLYRRSMAFGAPNEYERAHAEITRLRAELAECRRDAERYRWLIAHWDRIGVRVEYADGERHVVEINLLDPRKYPLNEESLVQAIDAARKGEGEG